MAYKAVYFSVYVTYGIPLLRPFKYQSFVSSAVFDIWNDLQVKYITTFDNVFAIVIKWMRNMHPQYED